MRRLLFIFIAVSVALPRVIVMPGTSPAGVAGFGSQISASDQLASGNLSVGQTLYDASPPAVRQAVDAGGTAGLGHGVLGVAGMLPGVGVAADVANAAWYASEGNYAMAAASAFFAVPVAGVAAAGLAKSGLVAKTITRGSREHRLARTTKTTNNPATKSVRYGPHNPGPLDDATASTFRSSSYTASELSEATTLYRVYGGQAGKLGSYWSRTRPSGPLQSQLDSALNPAWGNSASSVATIRVPAGTTIYEGAAASQSIAGGGSLLGGGSQVYIPRVSGSWLVP